MRRRGIFGHWRRDARSGHEDDFWDGCWWALAIAAPVKLRGADETQALLGRWDLTLKAGEKEYPSWLELKQEGGKLQATMVGRWGNARPLPSVEVKGAELTFVSPKEEEGSKTDLVFHGKLEGETLAGTVNGPDGAEWKWSGVKAPKLIMRGKPQWGDPVTLFDGTDLSGWRMAPEGEPKWTVKDGALVSPGHGPELMSEAKFQDFKLHVEFNCGKDANSGRLSCGGGTKCRSRRSRRASRRAITRAECMDFWRRLRSRRDRRIRGRH